MCSENEVTKSLYLDRIFTILLVTEMVNFAFIKYQKMCIFA